MKNSKGVTLTSLVIYIAVVIVVAATVIRITTYFKNNMADVADVSFETEFQKINLYLLTEAKTVGNGIKEIEQGKKIIFTNGNIYEYNSSNKTIYMNNIKICTDVEACTFSEKITDSGKTAIILEIRIAGISKTQKYVISNVQNEQIINETDYTWNTVE